MIEVRFFHKSNVLTGIQCNGHSGYAEKGSDIICAAVSTLMNSLIYGLVCVAESEGVNYSIDAKNISMRITWPEDESEKVFVLTQTVKGSLEKIARENSEYVKIISEVHNK